MRSVRDEVQKEESYVLKRGTSTALEILESRVKEESVIEQMELVSENFIDLFKRSSSVRCAFC